MGWSDRIQDDLLHSSTQDDLMPKSHRWDFEERPMSDAISMPNAEAEPTISVERAGSILGVCRNTAYEAAKLGQIPTIRIGKRLLVPTAAFLRLLDLEQAA